MCPAGQNRADQGDGATIELCGERVAREEMSDEAREVPGAAECAGTVDAFAGADRAALSEGHAGTAANVSDIRQAHALLHGHEKDV